MNQIDYTQLVRTWCLACTAVSAVAFVYSLFYLDPYVNNVYVWAFLIAFGVMIAAFGSWCAISYFYILEKKILSIGQVNNLLYQSTVSAATIIMVLTMQVTGILNIFTLGVVILCYSLYQIYINANSQ
jgi:uncharacterized membrane protein YvlD (DUF360 family)